VTGRYTGQPPGAGQPLTDAFAHVLTFRDGRVAELRQFTDSHRRQQAAAAGLGTVRRMFEAAERRDAQALLDTYAGDIVITEAASLRYGGVYHGHRGAVRHASPTPPPGTACKARATAGWSRSSGRPVTAWWSCGGRRRPPPMGAVSTCRSST